MADEVEGRRHCLVVGAEDPGGGLRSSVHHGFERDRLRCREGDVETRPVLVLAFAQPTDACVRAGDASGEHLLEALRFDGTVEAQNLDAPAAPATRARVPDGAKLSRSGKGELI